MPGGRHQESNNRASFGNNNYHPSTEYDTRGGHGANGGKRQWYTSRQYAHKQQIYAKNKFMKGRPGNGRMSEQIRQFYDELYPSDIPIENLDQQLRIWIAQFLENSLEMNAKQIEVRFFNSGADGFDVIDDGDGIREEDFELLPECLDERMRNEIYKSRSIGFKGEAMFCLIKSSDVTVMSKHKDSDKAFLVKFDRDG